MFHVLFALMLAAGPGASQPSEECDDDTAPDVARWVFPGIGIAFDRPSPGWDVEFVDERPEGKNRPKIVLDLPDVDGRINILVYEGEKLTLASVAQSARKGYLSLARLPKKLVKAHVMATPVAVAKDASRASFAVEGTFDGISTTGKAVVLPLSGTPNRKLVIMATGKSVAVQRILTDLDTLIGSLEIMER